MKGGPWPDRLEIMRAIFQDIFASFDALIRNSTWLDFTELRVILDWSYDEIFRVLRSLTCMVAHQRLQAHGVWYYLPYKKGTVSFLIFPTLPSLLNISSFRWGGYYYFIVHLILRRLKLLPQVKISIHRYWYRGMSRNPLERHYGNAWRNPLLGLLQKEDSVLMTTKSSDMWIDNVII